MAIGGCGGDGGCTDDGACDSSRPDSGQASPARADGEEASTAGRGMEVPLCLKCKRQGAQVRVRQLEPLCRACLVATLDTKLRATVRGGDLIRHGDTVVLAFSGGPGSRALLHLLSGIRAASSRKEDSRGKIAFNFAVLHVDISVALRLGPEEAAAQRASIIRCCSAPIRAEGSPPVSVLGLEDAFLRDDELEHALLGEGGARAAGHDAARVERLDALLSLVGDPTGREDLVAHIRDGLLLRAAAALGATRLAQGTTATRAAALVISSSAKGRGFSLPADLGLVDARARPLPAVIRPMRDCGLKEAALMCHLECLPTSFVPPMHPVVGARRALGPRSVNALADEFVAALQDGLSSSTFTILRTAAKLRPFVFNHAAVVPPPPGGGGRKARGKPNVGRERTPVDVGALEEEWQRVRLCELCAAPRPEGADPHGQGEAAHDGGGGWGGARWCRSCVGQIGDATPDGAVEGSLRALLPPPWVLGAGTEEAGGADGAGARLEGLRSQIEEYLIQE